MTSMDKKHCEITRGDCLCWIKDYVYEYAKLLADASYLTCITKEDFMIEADGDYVEYARIRWESAYKRNEINKLNKQLIVKLNDKDMKLHSQLNLHNQFEKKTIIQFQNNKAEYLLPLPIVVPYAFSVDYFTLICEQISQLASLKILRHMTQFYLADPDNQDEIAEDSKSVFNELFPDAVTFTIISQFNRYNPCASYLTYAEDKYFDELGYQKTTNSSYFIQHQGYLVRRY